jgi:hypothetical protein
MLYQLAEEYITRERPNWPDLSRPMTVDVTHVSVAFQCSNEIKLLHLLQIEAQTLPCALSFTNRHDVVSTAFSCAPRAPVAAVRQRFI